MGTVHRAVLLAVVALALPACDIQSMLMSNVPPPLVSSGIMDAQGDASGPVVVHDLRMVKTNRTGEPGQQRYTKMRLLVDFHQPSSLQLPPPGSHPASSGSELAWAICFDTGEPGGYVINSAVPDVACDYLLDGGALTAGQGGTGRLPGGTYRLVRVTSGTALSVTDTGARATVEASGWTMNVEVDIRPMNITVPSPAVGMIVAVGNRNGGTWNITDFAPDGAVASRL